MAAIRELYFTSLFVLFSQISGQQSGNSTIEQCGSSNLNIVFNFSLGGENFYERSWCLNSITNKIAAVASTGILTVEPPYSSRFNLSGTNGITLSHVSSSDSGSYLFIIVTDTSFTFLTATTTVIINDTPDNNCIPVTENKINSITCKIPAACPAKNNIQARWNNYNYTNVLTCPSTITKYNCCAVGDPVTKCYNGSLCTVDECKGTTTTTTSVTSPSSSSWSTSSSTSKPSSAPSTAITNNTSANLTTGTTANATNSASTLTSSIKTESTTSVTNNKSSNTTVAGSTSTSPTTTGSSKISSKSVKDGVAINVIVPAVVVPGGLLLIGVIILLVVCKRRSKARKNVHETLDGMAVQNRDSNVNGRKVSLNNGRAADKFDTVYTTPDGFIIYPGPAAMSTARPHKDKNYHDVTDQYNRPYAGTYGYQTSYVPSTYTSSRAYTHKDKKHHDVPHQYSRPYTGTYGYQAVHVPGTYMSDRDYNHKGKNYDNDEPNHHRAPHQMGTRRPAYMQTAYYPQTGYSGQISQDVYYRGGGQYSYGQRLKSDHDNSGRQQQREYNNQYEMADYGGIGAGYLHSAQYGKNTAFYY